MGRIKGGTVSVKPRLRDSRDSFGNYVEAWDKAVTVSNVVIAPGKCDALDATRPEGVTVALNLHFPKSFSGVLRDALVVLDGKWAGTYRVVGDPKPYMDANTPNDWDMPVEVEAVDG